MIQNALLSRLREKLKSANRRLLAAMVCYAILILIVLAEFLPVQSANDRFLLGVLLFVFALLIIKTLAHAGEDRSD